MNNFVKTFSYFGTVGFQKKKEITMDPQKVLQHLNFGRVDAETDDRLDSCFIGTELLRQVLLPQHSLLIGGKGSGKSAIFRLLSTDVQKIKPLFPKKYEEIFCIPAHGLQSEEYFTSSELNELNPRTVDDFRYFWLLYLGLKTATFLAQDAKIREIVSSSKIDRLKESYSILQRVVSDIGLVQEKNLTTKIRQRVYEWLKLSSPKETLFNPDVGNVLSLSFKQKAGISVVTLLDHIDTVLVGTNCLAWILLDKLDLLYIGDVERMKNAITGLVQLIIEYGNRFKNIHLKVFLRTDIYRQLHIVNKSHLVSYTSDMKWRDSLLLKLLVSRAVSNQYVQNYCEVILGKQVDVSNVIIGEDSFVLDVFYTIFEPIVKPNGTKSIKKTQTHEWILRRLIDGLGTSFPRELIYLGNLAAAKQREMNKIEGKHTSEKLISSRALKEAFNEVSAYRCDTYLYSEFPHLAKHFDVFRGSETSVFHREELYMLFEPLNPKGDDAIRAVYHTGLLLPLSGNVDSCSKFKIPLLYKTGLGISDKRLNVSKRLTKYTREETEKGKDRTDL